VSFEDKSIQCSDCGLPLASVLKSGSFSNLKATPMSPSAAHPVAWQEKRSVMGIVAPGTEPGRCSL